MPTLVVHLPLQEADEVLASLRGAAAAAGLLEPSGHRVGSTCLSVPEDPGDELDEGLLGARTERHHAWAGSLVAPAPPELAACLPGLAGPPGFTGLSGFARLLPGFHFRLTPDLKRIRPARRPRGPGHGLHFRLTPDPKPRGSVSPEELARGGRAFQTDF